MDNSQRISKLESFVLEHYPCSQLWEDGSLRNWLLWAESEGYLFTATDGDNLVGLTIARPLDDITVVMGPTGDHDPDSQNIYTDLTISTHRDAMKAMILSMVTRFGVRDTLCFHRHGRSFTPKQYNFRKFAQRLIRN